MTASLINKGQKPEKTTELFRAMIDADIRPHAMLMFHDGQPFYSRGSLYGLYNQIEFLRRAGVVSVQCTLHMPAVGTREFEQTYDSGRVIRSVGGHEIPESHFDGNHVVVTGHVAPWKRQLQMLAGYLAFYNPWNLLRALLIHDGRGVAKRRIEFHVVGMLASILDRDEDCCRTCSNCSCDRSSVTGRLLRTGHGSFIVRPLPLTESRRPCCL